MSKSDWTQVRQGCWRHVSGTEVRATDNKIGDLAFWNIIWASGYREPVLHLGSKQAVRIVEQAYETGIERWEDRR